MRILITCLFAFFFIANVFADGVPKNVAPINGKPFKIFGYSQSANSATIEADPDNGSNAYILIAKGIKPEIVYSSDRPHRISGTIKMKNFVKKWQEPSNKNSYAVSPPNVQISWLPVTVEKPLQAHVIHAILKTAEYDEAKGIATYHITLFNNELPLPKKLETGKIWFFITGHKAD